MVGEGHGKFPALLLKRNPAARLTCVEALKCWKLRQNASFAHAAGAL